MIAATSAPRSGAVLQAEAAARLAELGLPHAKLEEWRFTNPAAITKVEWAPAKQRTSESNPSLTDMPFPHHLAATLDGHPHAPSAVAQGLTVAALASDAALPEAYATIADTSAPTHAFTLMNAARTPGVLHVRATAAVAEPLVINHARGARGADAAPTLIAPRLLVELAAGSSLTLVEDFRGVAAGADFTDAVTEIALGEGAALTLVRLVGERAQGFHVGLAAARIGKDARLTVQTFAPGGPLVRDDVHALFAATGGEVHLDGLFTVSGTQVVDHHTIVDHAAPHCTSREFYKGVLAGSGRGVFNGAVVIRPGAQKSDSNQRNMNLLLSTDATIDTKPELQIHADDVKCGHGATVGRLDDDALFYLRARGIGPAEARAMLVGAFAREVVERVEHVGLRTAIDAWIDERMTRLGREVL